ncbi:NAD(P)H-hydrate dehydratase [Seleniivibrio woodruffii]|uniref:NAD(P)H-hydrate dehydratase n=1 Tax=Seleniivibrio woodruffii TaxID=1078050 RepID=UPI00240A2B3B|nr:NAD(P)H-hydrate dehydratase [Seleniivibrio woodruffii]
MEILSSAQMAEADSFTINTIGIPSAVLMENAAGAFVRILLEKQPEMTSAAVVCGCGNNGGDGLAAARHLTNAGIHTDVYLACDPEKLKGDALTNLNILKNYPINVFTVTEDEIPSFEGYDVTVDALFGTGLKRPLEGFYEELVYSMNLSAEYIASVDIPSGLSGDSWLVEGTAADADLTVTFARPKYPHVMYPARKLCGEVIIADISIPDFAISGCDTFLLTPDNLPAITPREPDSHKGHFGHAVVIGGSAGKSGAVLMASRACAVCGAGLTTSAVPAGILAAAENANPEIMTFPVGISGIFTANGADRLAEFLKGKTVASIGMGIGTNPETAEFLDHIIENTDLPLIIDADGINLLQQKHYKKLSGRCAITPHIGEFARLLKLTTDELNRDRLNLARKFASETGIILVQKSADTLIALPNGLVFVDISGSPALSKGGSGDCLTGLITGFAAQGFDLDFACMLGSFTLGRAAELVLETMNEKTVLTTDIINTVGKVLDELEQNS